MHYDATPQRFYAVYDRGTPIKTAKSQLVQQPLRQSTVETATPYSPSGFSEVWLVHEPA